jgi:large subunit ribosomal protein L10
MNRDQKAALVEEIAGQIQAAEAVFAVDYRGLSVPQAAELRAKLRDADASFRVVKNSLTERAADKAGAEELKTLLIGPTALTFVRGDAALAAKALNDTARALHILEFKGGLLGGSTLTADDVRSIARLPSRDVLNAQLVGTIASPITGLVRGLAGLISGIARQLQQMADQGLVSGTAPEASDASGSPEGGASSEAVTRVASDEEPPSEGAPAVEAEAPEAATPPDSQEEPSEPEAAAEPSEPEAAAEPSEPEAAAEPSEPEAAAEPSEPEAAAEPSEPDAAAEPGAEPKVEAAQSTEETEPDAAGDAEQSDAKE